MISDIFGAYDVSSWTLNPVPVAGRYPKHELLNEAKRYIVKLAAFKQNGQEVPYHVSEYLSCRILKSMDYSTQEVAMVMFYNNPACLIEVFDEQLITFEGLGTSTLSQENLAYDLDLLSDIFNEGKFDGSFEEYLWDTFICDAFINNLDRHPNNWGFFRRRGTYYPAPLIDCASSLYSINAFSLSKMNDIESYINKFGNSAIRYMGERVSFENVLESTTSQILKNRIALFKRKLGRLNLSCIKHVKHHWPQYATYTDFVEKFILRQVHWFETKL